MKYGLEFKWNLGPKVGCYPLFPSKIEEGTSKTVKWELLHACMDSEGHV